MENTLVLYYDRLKKMKKKKAIGNLHMTNVNKEDILVSNSILNLYRGNFFFVSNQTVRQSKNF